MALEQAGTAERAVETQLIPFQELSTGQAAAIRNAAIRAVVAKASHELKLSPNKLLVRGIRPKEDFGYSYATWYDVTGTAGVYESVYDSVGTMGSDRYAGIYGVQDESSAINCPKIKIKVGNSTKVIWMLQNLYSDTGEGPRIGFSPSVVIIPANQTFDIQRYVENASSTVRIVLKGFIVERIGKVLSP